MHLKKQMQQLIAVLAEGDAGGCSFQRGEGSRVHVSNESEYGRKSVAVAQQDGLRVDDVSGQVEELHEKQIVRLVLCSAAIYLKSQGG